MTLLCGFDAIKKDLLSLYTVFTGRKHRWHIYLSDINSNCQKMYISECDNNAQLNFHYKHQTRCIIWTRLIIQSVQKVNVLNIQLSIYIMFYMDFLKLKILCHENEVIVSIGNPGIRVHGQCMGVTGNLNSYQ